MTFASTLFLSAGILFIVGVYSILLFDNIWVGPLGILMAVFLAFLAGWVWFLGPLLGILPALLLGTAATGLIVVFGLYVIHDDLEWAARN